MSRQEKAAAVSELRQKFSSARATVLTEYRGLSVPEMGKLRRSLRAVAAEYRVAKNTLARRAAEGTPLAQVAGELRGPVGLAIAYEDPVVLAKTLAQYSGREGRLVIKAAVVEGEALAAEGIRALALLPDVPGLRAQLLALIQTPAARLVRVLCEPAAALVRVIAARREAIGSPGGEEN